jgi:hypothetical protein
MLLINTKFVQVAIVRLSNAMQNDVRRFFVNYFDHFTRGVRTREVSIVDRMYELAQYPLLFPTGRELTWSSSLQQHGRSSRFTLAQYIRQVALTNQYMWLFGRLFQEYICDMFSRLEDQRLFFRTQHVDRLAPSSRDDIMRQDGRRGPILSASFTGSPRYYSAYCQDALALTCGEGGLQPEYFITLTANPSWPEFQVELLPGQTINDRPDLLTRIFMARVDAIRPHIERIFGRGQRTGMYIEVFQFQGRGLPHVHIVYSREAGSPAITLADIDEVITAEMPPSDGTEAMERTRQLVRAHLIHQHSERCLRRTGECQWNYPQPRQERTAYVSGTARYGGRVIYRRRNPDTDSLVVPSM